MPTYVPVGKAAELTGLHPHTLRKYADQGDIPHYRLPNGDRRFDVSAWQQKKTACVGYARVSQPKQKQDLDRQAQLLAAQFPGCEIVRDIGSGLNFKRKGLNAILDRAIQGEALTVYITYRDRLARFGFDLIERIITKAGGKIVVLHQIETSPIEELTQDLTTIITVFSSRLHGLRSHKNKKGLVEALTGSKADIEALDGRVQESL